LALVTAPSYDPSILVGETTTIKKLYMYRGFRLQSLFMTEGYLLNTLPGSPFKITGLMGLQGRVIDEQTTFMSSWL
jgi:penicillin-binding protein 2